MNLPKTAKDETGNTIHRWTFLRYVGPGPKKRGSLWECRCECGTIRTVLAADIRRGVVRSCGCAFSDYCDRRRSGARTRAGAVWREARKRCCDPHHLQYADYGGRGVTMCHRWHTSLPSFIEDMGQPPQCLQLERIDNGGGYWCGHPECPDCGPAGRAKNCRWATRQEQANNKRNNRRIAYNGLTLTVAEWTRRLGFSRWTLRNRLAAGWPIDRMMTTPEEHRKARR